MASRGLELNLASVLRVKPSRLGPAAAAQAVRALKSSRSKWPWDTGFSRGSFFAVVTPTGVWIRNRARYAGYVEAGIPNGRTRGKAAATLRAARRRILRAERRDRGRDILRESDFPQLDVEQQPALGTQQFSDPTTRDSRVRATRIQGERTARDIQILREPGAITRGSRLSRQGRTREAGRRRARLRREISRRQKALSRAQPLPPGRRAVAISRASRLLSGQSVTGSVSASDIALAMVLSAAITRVPRDG